MTPPQQVSQDVGHRVQKQAELIGLEAMAGGPVGAKMGLVVLDQKLHPPSIAVEVFIDDPGGLGDEIRHHEAGVRSEGVVLGLDDNPLVFSPTLGSIEELAEVANRLAFPAETPFGRRDQGRGVAAQDGIRRQPQQVLQVLGPAKGEDFGRGVVGIAPQQDAHFRPSLANLSDDPLEDRDDLLAGRPLSRPQDRGDELSAPALVDVDREITVLVVKGVEQGHLLMSVGRVFGVVDVEQDRDRRSPVRVEEHIDQDFGKAVEIGPGDGVFQARERRLAGQGLAVGKSFAGHLKGGVGAQSVGIVGVLVAAGDLEDSLRKHLADGMAGIAGMAAVVDDLGDLTNQAQPVFDFAKEQNAGIGGDLAAVEVDLDLFSLDVFKKKALGATIVHGCFLLHV